MYRSRCGVVLTGDPTAVAAIEIEGRARRSAYLWLQAMRDGRARVNVFRFSLRGPDEEWQPQIAAVAGCLCNGGRAVNLWPITDSGILRNWVEMRLNLPIWPVFSPIEALAAQRRAEMVEIAGNSREFPGFSEENRQKPAFEDRRFRIAAMKV